jgi:hypothetical protein
MIHLFYPKSLQRIGRLSTKSFDFGILIAHISHMEKTETITIRGILIPSAWNEKGDVVALFIATYKEEKYLVSDRSIVQKLLPLLRKKVIVSGIINRQDAKQVIDIKDVKIDTYTSKEKRRKMVE